jgi:hypothetical protein
LSAEKKKKNHFARVSKKRYFVQPTPAPTPPPTPLPPGASPAPTPAPTPAPPTPAPVTYVKFFTRATLKIFFKTKKKNK